MAPKPVQYGKGLGQRAPAWRPLPPGRASVLGTPRDGPWGRLADPAEGTGGAAWLRVLLAVGLAVAGLGGVLWASLAGLLGAS